MKPRCRTDGTITDASAFRSLGTREPLGNHRHRRPAAICRLATADGRLTIWVALPSAGGPDLLPLPMWISTAGKSSCFCRIDDFPGQLVMPCGRMRVDTQREEPATDDEK